MTDFVADCVTDFCICMSSQGGGEIVWCDICFILLIQRTEGLTTNPVGQADGIER